MDLLNSLNDKQREAASHDKGPVLVIAGAGTGKTRVLTHRIAYLIKTGKAHPREILSITFTNKAANEMKERIGQLIDYNIDRMWIGTFHSICVRVLRKNIEKIGYDKNFVIYDTDDQKLLVKDCIKEMDLDVKKYNVNAIRSRISNLKNSRISPDKFINDNYTDFYLRNVGELYSLYEKKMKISNALDFDDLLIKTLSLFENNKDVLLDYQDRFKYVLVDEYQDTNRVQYLLVRMIGKKNNGESNVFVVGDEDQSIYGWRGADIHNILDFEKDFKGAKVIKLEQNYRSTDIILNAANSVIKNNSQRKGKNLWTDFEEGELIRVIEVDNEKEEAFMIASSILKEIKNDLSYSNMAILYRTNSQSRALEERLIREGIRYKIVGGLKFYGRKEIKDIIAYLMLVQNPKDNISFRRIINVPRRKIGKKTIDTIQTYANNNELSLFEAAYEVRQMELTSSAVKSVEKFISIIELLMVKKDAMSLSEFMQAIYEDTGYKAMLESEDTIEGRSRVENVNEFFSAAVDFEERYEQNTLEDFLAHISLLSDVDKTDEKANDCVTLLTVHSAKGLEYDVVFIAGLEEKMFPIIRDNDGDDEDIEEERRLFYVAVTRAKKTLYLSFANERMVFGNHMYRTKSRFINEIPFEYLDVEEERTYVSKTKQKKQETKELFKGEIDLFSDIKPKYEENNKKTDKLCMGDKVKHKAWGIGTIVQMKGEGEDTMVTIAFENKGIKTLMLSFAPIEKA